MLPHELEHAHCGLEDFANHEVDENLRSEHTCLYCNNSPWKRGCAQSDFNMHKLSDDLFSQSSHFPQCWNEGLGHDINESTGAANVLTGKQNHSPYMTERFVCVSYKGA
jgi:hypothetical protein